MTDDEPQYRLDERVMVAMVRDVSVADALQAVYDAHKVGEITSTDVANFIQHLFHHTEPRVAIEVLSKLLAYYERELEDMT